jgi:hypothetical protein
VFLFFISFLFFYFFLLDIFLFIILQDKNNNKLAERERKWGQIMNYDSKNVEKGKNKKMKSNK